VALALADHRNRMINRPRVFSDWAWSLGLDPGVVLIGVGVVATILAAFLFLRRQPWLKLFTSLLLLLLLGGAFFLLKDKRIDTKLPLDPLGLSGKGKEGQGKPPPSGKGSSGKGAKNPFQDDYSSSTPPSPVAIAILRDDFQPSKDIMYFRQVALSTYNGHHLVNGQAQGWDLDVLTEFPRLTPLQAKGDHPVLDHLVVPSTMYLLVDHPQPLTLSQAVTLAPAHNPNPQQFVAAYDVVSQVLALPPQRLLGRRSISETWDAQTRAHYLALPDDPRYRALSDLIVHDVDPRFASDDLARAYAIKRFLEREGFYTMKSTHSSSSDPTASFLFSSLRGYCVHFAHAAVYLMRSQGIAARVALGYAVQTNKRSGGSSILIMSDRAHAWPEIYLQGIGWITFDIYPERTDMPSPELVDYDLEKLLGELARNDQTAGLRADGRPLVIPWRALLQSLALLLGVLLTLTYLIKLFRQLAPRLTRVEKYPRRAYLAVLDRLSDLGHPRQQGETRERHARRLAQLSPHLMALTLAHLSLALGGAHVLERAQFAQLVDQVLTELRQNVPFRRRFTAQLNPLGWLRTR
jgi:protein-glutamine gamma-glutamyltransferase